MDTLSLLGIAAGLSMDALAVSIASGAMLKRRHVYHALRMAAFFGIFQSLMPALGWYAGHRLRSLITQADHWVAFAVLAVVGGKMIRESYKLGGEADDRAGEHPTGRLLLLALATSVDAAAVGLGFAFLRVEIVYPILVIGGVTFALCLAGGLIGSRLGHRCERKIGLVGGLILIAIGVKILVEHLGQ